MRECGLTVDHVTVSDCVKTIAKNKSGKKLHSFDL